MGSVLSAPRDRAAAIGVNVFDVGAREKGRSRERHSFKGRSAALKRKPHMLLHHIG